MTNPAPPGGQQAPSGQPFPGQPYPTGPQSQGGPPPSGQFQSGHFQPVQTGPSVVFAEPGPPGPLDSPRIGRPTGALLPVLSAALLVIAGGLAIGGSFGKLEEETEHAGDQTLTLTYTAWHLKQGGSFTDAIYFHAPHFGIPLVAAGALAVIGGLLLILGRGTLATLAKPAAIASAGLLVGAVWAVGLVVSADLDAVTHNDAFQLDWTSGIGFWLLVAAGVAAVIGGVLAVLTSATPAAVREEPPTPRYGFPAIQGMQGPPSYPGMQPTQSSPGMRPVAPTQSSPGMRPVQPLPGTQSSPGMRPVPGPQDQDPAGPQAAPGQRVDPLGGHPIGPPTPQPFQPPTPPSPGPANPA